MRRDMAKKLCESARINDMWGSRDKSDRKKKIHVQELIEFENEDGEIVLDVEDSGLSRQAMSIGRGSKVLGENLAPLYRFLDSKVGTPWDKVYSEIKEHVRVDSATQLHIIQHLESRVSGLVGSNLEEENGKIYEIRTFNRERMELWKDDLFIHPRTKILLKYKKNPRKNRYASRLPQKSDIVKIDHVTYFCKIDGIWHEVTYDSKWGKFENRLDFTSKFCYGLAGHPKAFKTYLFKNEYTMRMIPKKILEERGLKNDK